MDEHIPQILQIIGIIVTILVLPISVVVSLFVAGWKKGVDAKLLQLDKDVKELKDNYIGEFKAVREAISDASIAQVQAIADLSQVIAEMEKKIFENVRENYVPREMCAAWMTKNGG